MSCLYRFFDVIIPRIAVVALLISSVASLPTPINFQDFENFLHNHVLPKKGEGTTHDELMCYGLPYGGIGFASHILTYWTVAWLCVGKRSLRPNKPLTHSWIDMLLSIASLIITVPVSVFTIIRCIGRWQFVLLAIWKMSMSLTLAAVGTHRSVWLFRNRKSAL
jgi:hypothetical protein